MPTLMTASQGLSSDHKARSFFWRHSVKMDTASGQMPAGRFLIAVYIMPSIPSMSGMP